MVRIERGAERGGGASSWTGYEKRCRGRVPSGRHLDPDTSVWLWTEREGFEPSIGVDPLCRFSKPVPSASRPSLPGTAAPRGASLSQKQRTNVARGELAT